MSTRRYFFYLCHIHDLFGLEGRFECLRVSEDTDIISASGACNIAKLTISIQDALL
jgi:hypothetical protein